MLDQQDRGRAGTDLAGRGRPDQRRVDDLDGRGFRGQQRQGGVAHVLEAPEAHDHPATEVRERVALELDLGHDRALAAAEEPREVGSRPLEGWQVVAVDAAEQAWPAIGDLAGNVVVDRSRSGE